MQKELRVIMFSKDITQKALAKEIGISETSLMRKMRGYIDFTYTEVYDICRVLGIDNPLEVFKPKKKNEMR